MELWVLLLLIGHIIWEFHMLLKSVQCLTCVKNAMQRRIQFPIKYLRWRFLQKQLTARHFAHQNFLQNFLLVMRHLTIWEPFLSQKCSGGSKKSVPSTFRTFTSWKNKGFPILFPFYLSSSLTLPITSRCIRIFTLLKETKTTFFELLSDN